MAERDEQSPAPVEGGTEQQAPQPAKKFLGKYASEEEAERGYKELERFAYDQSRQAADARKQLEQFAAMQVPDSTYGIAQYVPQAQGQQYGYQDQRAQAELQDFYNNPLQHLKKRDESVSERTASKVRAEMRAEFAARDALNSWKAANPDLVRHEPLVATFVAQQPANMPVMDKLERAADEARRYLANEVARNGQNRQAPTPSSYVEAPGGGANVSARGMENQEPISEETELADYIRGRNAVKDKRMNVR